MSAREHYQAGRLAEAIVAATDDVKQHPGDVGRRSFLVELLCFSGDYERADKQLEVLVHQNPEVATGFGMLRQLIRAEQARQQFFTDGRVPEFLELPTPRMRKLLEASILLREGKTAEAASLLDSAEAERPKAAGTSDGRAFEDFRDVDDLTAGVFEVLTSTGKYFWIPVERVELVEFRPYQRPHDLLWRRVHMVVNGGPDGEVYLPTLYAGAAAETDEQLRLGRMTDWRGGEGMPLRGVGQRLYSVGGEDVPILELKTLTFNAPVAAAPVEEPAATV